MRNSKLPEFVYRAFDEEEHALEFLNKGRFRIGSLTKYKTIEDENRKDSTEGEAYYRFEDDIQLIQFSLGSDETRTLTKKGLMNVNATWGAPTYIFCTSLPDVEISHLKKTFGEYLVRINDLEQFMRDMKKALLNTDYKFIGRGDVQGKIVEYSKGDVFPKDLDGFESCELAYVQKAPSFKPDCEFRFVAMMNITNQPEEIPEYVELNFGKKIEYAELIVI